MTCPILECGPFRRELARTLADHIKDAAELHRRIVVVRADLARELPGTDLSLVEYAFKSVERLLQLDELEHFPRFVEDIPRARARVARIWLLRGFLRALSHLPRLHDHAGAIASLLAPHLPSRDEMLGRLRSGPGFLDALADAALDLCMRDTVDVRSLLIRLGRDLAAEIACLRQDGAALAEWLHHEGGVVATAVAPALRVLSIRLVDAADRGWTVVWARGVTPGRRSIEVPIPAAARTVVDIDDLWRVLRPAAAHLIMERFVERSDQLILNIELPSCHALEGFHRATDRRANRAWAYFGAVTLWPWFNDPGDVAGYRYDRVVHRPTAVAPSETVALHDRSVDLVTLRASMQRRVLLVCTEPTWRPGDDGLSAAIDTHEHRTASILLAGDDGEAFLDILFADGATRPFHEVFRAARAWLDRDRDLHFLWTDPDYKANLHTFEVLP